MSTPSVEQLADLFRGTGKAHHQAFIEVDGADPEWPLWYADHLVGPLGDLLGGSMTRSELIYLLVLADKEMGVRAPGAVWPRFYARFFLERYG